MSLRKGFTLIEILLVITLIGIFVGSITYFTRDSRIAMTNAERLANNIGDSIKNARNNMIIGRGIYSGSQLVSTEKRTISIKGGEITTTFAYNNGTNTGTETSLRYPFYDNDGQYQITDVSVSSGVLVNNYAMSWDHTGVTTADITVLPNGDLTIAAVKGGVSIPTPINTIRITAGYQGFERSVVLDRVMGRMDVIKGKEGSDNPPTSTPPTYTCSPTLPLCSALGRCSLIYSPTSTNQAWSKGSASCGFNCTNGYSDPICATPPPPLPASCATPLPSFPNIGLTFTGSPSSPSQSWTYSPVPGNCTYNCIGGYTGINCAIPPPLPNSCAANPTFANLGTLSTGSPSSPSQSWTYSAIPGNCTYTCIGGYSGNGCAIAPGNSCAANPTFANLGTLSTGTPSSPSQSWTYSAVPGNCTYTCNNGYSGNGCAVAPISSCAANPTFANLGTLSIGSPSSPSQSWTYSPVPGNCTYTCSNGYSGNGCSTPPAANSCAAPIPSFPNIGTLTYSPTSVNQSWSYNSSSCGYTCTGGYSGSGCLTPPSACNLPWGGSIADGASVTAWSLATATSPTLCTSENRICTNGTLAGSYMNSSCTQEYRSCNLPWGGSIIHGASVSAYASPLVNYPSTCSSESRSCNDATLGGSFTNSSCTVRRDCEYTTAQGSSCSATCGGGNRDVHYTITTPASGGGTCAVSEWQFVGWTGASCNTGACGPVCGSTANTCTSGTPSGYSPGVCGGSQSWTCTSGSSVACSLPNTSCASCNLPWGGSIAHGASINAYAANSVPCGSSCSSEVRTCNNGILAGSYTNANCSVIACASCNLPWGGSIANGASVTAWNFASPTSPTMCNSQIRNCNNGTLGGSFTNASCAQQYRSCNLPWGGSIAHGASVSAYASALVNYPSTCSSQSRGCNDGTLGGSFTNASCTVRRDCEYTTYEGGTCSASCGGGNFARYYTITAAASGGGTCAVTEGQFAGWTGGSCNTGGCGCNLPWGGSIPSGSSVTAWNIPSASSPQMCDSETRSCAGSFLGGSYTFSSCTQSYRACDLPWGGTTPHFSSVTAYASPSVVYPASCNSQLRNCEDFVLDGSYTYSSCTVTYTYAWRTNSWGACSPSCGPGTQTRSVWCERNDGTTVADGFCGGGKPTTSQSCNNGPCPINCSGYFAGWGSCSASCGPGTQYNTFVQTTAAQYGGLSCTSIYGAENGQQISQSCNNGPCPVNGSCGGSNNTCSSGSPSGFSAGSCGGSSSWTCVGQYGGSNASCGIANSPCPVNGSCGGSNNTCSSGSPSGFSAGSCGGSSSWTCVGQYGGSNASCGIANSPCPVNCTYNTYEGGSCSASCGGGNRDVYYNIVTPAMYGGSCAVSQGQFAGYIGSSCNTNSCGINGVCGGTANTCSAGSPSGYVAGNCNGSSSWTCLGSGGGSDASCSRANASCIWRNWSPSGCVISSTPAVGNPMTGYEDYFGACSTYGQVITAGAGDRYAPCPIGRKGVHSFKCY